MSIVLSTISSEGEFQSIQRERESGPVFPRVYTIDPDRILEAEEGNSSTTFQGRENIAGEILSLHSRLEQLVGLLSNCPSFGEVLGQNQVISIGSLKEALDTIPEGPISLDMLKVAPPEILPMLLTLTLRHSDIYGLPVIDTVEFHPAPKWVPIATKDNLMIVLRESRTGEKIRPTFFTDSAMPPGAGVLDDGWSRARPNPTSFLFAVTPSDSFQIDQGAVENFDEFLGRLDINTGIISS